MKARGGVCGGLAVAVAMLVMAMPVCAQTARPARPYRALFGGDASNQTSRHHLDLTFSLIGGLDNGLGTPLAGTPDPDEALRGDRFGEFYSAGASLGYALRGSRTQAGATATASLPYYSTVPELKELGYGANASIGHAAGRTTMSAAGSYRYSPFYNSLLEPGSGAALPSSDFGDVVNPNDVVSVSASLSQRLGRSTSMNLGYTLHGVQFERGAQDTLSQGVLVSARGGFTRRTTLSGSYSYQAGDSSTQGSSRPSASHNVDTTVAYTRELSRRRSFSLSGTVGASLVDYLGVQDQGWRASVAVSQTLSDDWSVGASFGRYLRLSDVVLEPVWSDNLGMTVRGQVGRRVAAELGAGFTRGEQVGGAGAAYETYYGRAGAQFALSKLLAVTANYLYYRYDYPPGYSLPAGMPRRLDRQRVQFGASLWLPLARTGRAREAGSRATQ